MDAMAIRNERYVLTWNVGRLAVASTFYTPSTIQTLQKGGGRSQLEALIVANGICVGADAGSQPFNAVALAVAWTAGGGTKLMLKLSGKQANDSIFRQYTVSTTTAGVTTMVNLSFETVLTAFITEPIRLIDGYFQIEAAATGAPIGDLLVIRPVFGTI